MHDSATLAHTVRVSEELVLRYVEGFDDTNRTARVDGLPNHLSWTIGHLSLTMHRAADKVAGFTDPQALPTTDWVAGDGTAGDPSRYDIESVCYGSKPVADSKRYPRLDRSVAIFRSSIDRLAVATAEATPAMLEKEIAWGSTELAAGDLVTRVVFHNGIHAGQLIDLRRALGHGAVTG